MRGLIFVGYFLGGGGGACAARRATRTGAERADVRAVRPGPSRHGRDYERYLQSAGMSHVVCNDMYYSMIPYYDTASCFIGAAVVVVFRPFTCCVLYLPRHVLLVLLESLFVVR